MVLSDVSIKRPVFATVISLMLMVLGLAALMRQPVVLVYTHDSIGLGEDGPTHQPVEHLAALRAIPELLVMRPILILIIFTSVLLAALVNASAAPFASLLSSR